MNSLIDLPPPVLTSLVPYFHRSFFQDLGHYWVTHHPKTECACPGRLSTDEVPFGPRAFVHGVPFQADQWNDDFRVRAFRCCWYALDLVRRFRGSQRHHLSAYLYERMRAWRIEECGVTEQRPRRTDLRRLILNVAWTPQFDGAAWIRGIGVPPIPVSGPGMGCADFAAPAEILGIVGRLLYPDEQAAIVEICALLLESERLSIERFCETVVHGVPSAFGPCGEGVDYGSPIRDEATKRLHQLRAS